MKKEAFQDPSTPAKRSISFRRGMEVRGYDASSGQGFEGTVILVRGGLISISSDAGEVRRIRIENVVPLAEVAGTRLAAMTRVLQDEGGPLHYSVIAERVNPHLPLECKMDPNNVHSWLSRYPSTYVWVSRGTYGLRAWRVAATADEGAIPPHQFQVEERRADFESSGQPPIAAGRSSAPAPLLPMEGHGLVSSHARFPEYELPPFTWDQLLTDPALAVRLREFGLRSIPEVGILAPLVLEGQLAGRLAAEATRLLEDLEDYFARSLVFRPCSVKLEMSSTHSEGAVSYHSSMVDDGAALSWRVDLATEEFEDIWSGQTKVQDILNRARVCAFTSWPCQTPFDFLSRTTLPAFDPWPSVEAALKLMTPKEGRVLALRYGLVDGNDRTLEEVGREFGVTRERIRQIEAKAIKNLQRPQLAERLEEVLRAARYLSALLAIDINAAAFPYAYAAATPDPPGRAHGLLNLVIAVLGKEAIPNSGDALGQFERWVFVSLFGVLRRVPSMTELTIPPASAVRFVMAMDEASKAVEFRWQKFSPYGRLKLVVPAAYNHIVGPEVHPTRLEALTHVFENEGRPLHYSVVTERVNSLLRSKDRMTERSVHAWLGRYTDRFTWVGPGKYGLHAWGVGSNVDRASLPVQQESRGRHRRGVGDDITEMLRKAKGTLPLQGIEEGILSRFAINRSSVRAAIEQDSARRFVIYPDDSVALVSWHRRRAGARKRRSLVDSLDMGSIAFPTLAPSERKEAVRLSGHVTLGEVRQFIDPGDHPYDGASVALEALGRAFNSNIRFNHLRQALWRFDEQFDSWATKTRRDPRWSWIVPDSLAQDLMSKRKQWRYMQSELSDLGSWRLRLWECERIDSWLPLLSIEGVIEIAKLRETDFAVLSAAIGRANVRLDLASHLRPWESSWPRRLAPIPTDWLYQFDPRPRLEAVLRRLQRAGCVNMGHLVIFGPEVRQLARKSPVQDWARLKNALNR